MQIFIILRLRHARISQISSSSSCSSCSSSCRNVEPKIWDDPTSMIPFQGVIFVDIRQAYPHKWDVSSGKLTRGNGKFPCFLSRGNTFSNIQMIRFPIAMLVRLEWRETSLLQPMERPPTLLVSRVQDLSSQPWVTYNHAAWGFFSRTWKR